MTAYTPRRAARVLLVDAAGRVLLFHGFDPARPEHRVLVHPRRRARRRRVVRRTARRGSWPRRPACGCTPAELGEPVWRETTEFPFDGVWYRQEQDFFLVRVPSWEVDTAGFDDIERGIDRRVTAGGTLAELEATGERFYPRRPAGAADAGRGVRMLTPPRTVVRREGGLYALERALQRRGFRHVAGADEAGRGACAGPLVAAAAVLPEGERGEIDGLADSKLLTPAGPGADLRRGGRRARWRTPWWSSRPTRSTPGACTCATWPRCAGRWPRWPTRPEYVLTDGFRRRRAGTCRGWRCGRATRWRPAWRRPACSPRSPGTGSWSSWTSVFPAYGFAEHKGYITPEHSAGAARARAVRASTGSRTSTWPQSPGATAGRPAAAGRWRPGRREAAAEPSRWSALEPPGGTVGVASGERPRPPAPVGEDVAMEGGVR